MMSSTNHDGCKVSKPYGLIICTAASLSSQGLAQMEGYPYLTQAEGFDMKTSAHQGGLQRFYCSCGHRRMGTSTVPTFAPVAYADGLVAEGKEAMKGTGKSLTDATGKLKTDATQTKEEEAGLDKTKQASVRSRETSKRSGEGAKGALANPLGK